MIRRSLVLLVVAALVVSATVVLAIGPRGRGTQPVAPGAGMGCPMMGGRILGDLGLTKEQLAQMQQLRQEFFDVTKATREEIQSKAKEMANLWSQDTPNALAIKSLAAEIDALRAEIRNTAIDYALRGLALLTVEQRAKLREKIQNWCAGGCCCWVCPGPCCGMGPGLGMGPGCRMGAGGLGMGPGAGDGTGPRARMGTCPLLNK